MSYGDSHQPGNSRNQNINLDLAETLHSHLSRPAHWATPVANPANGTPEQFLDRKRRAVERGSTMGIVLSDLQMQALAYSLPAPATSTDGEPSSKERRSLNPLFVEWLMGWPRGWTLLASTDFACSATELSHYRQHMRSAFLRLALPPEAPPAQLALFG